MSENVFIHENCYYVRRTLGLHSGIVYSKLGTATKLRIFINHVNVTGNIINASGLLLD